MFVGLVENLRILVNIYELRIVFWVLLWYVGALVYLVDKDVRWCASLFALYVTWIIQQFHLEGQRLTQEEDGAAREGPRGARATSRVT